MKSRHLVHYSFVLTQVPRKKLHVAVFLKWISIKTNAAQTFAMKSILEILFVMSDNIDSSVRLYTKVHDKHKRDLIITGSLFRRGASGQPIISRVPKIQIGTHFLQLWASRGPKLKILDRHLGQNLIHSFDGFKRFAIT